MADLLLLAALPIATLTDRWHTWRHNRRQRHALRNLRLDMEHIDRQLTRRHAALDLHDPDRCWADLTHRGVAACDAPAVSGLGLCAEHLDELREGADRV